MLFKEWMLIDREGRNWKMIRGKKRDEGERKASPTEQGEMERG